MLRFILILEEPADDSHAKNSEDVSGILTIKYLVNTSVSFCFAERAYDAYASCVQSLKIGVSFMKPRRFITVEM